MVICRIWSTELGSLSEWYSTLWHMLARNEVKPQNKFFLRNDFESEIVMFMQNYLWFFIHRFWIEYVFTETFVILVKKIDFNKLRFMIFKLCRHDWLNIVLRVIVMTLKDVLKLNRHWIFHTKSIRNKNKTLFQIITE